MFRLQYAIIIGIIFFLQVAAGIVAVLFRGRVRNQIQIQILLSPLINTILHNIMQQKNDTIN